jgi:hypothetical protein
MTRGLSMSEEQIALLKSLALRPSDQIAPGLRSILDALVQAGYVTYGSSGWTATAEGCNVIERKRINVSTSSAA